MRPCEQNWETTIDVEFGEEGESEMHECEEVV